VKSSRDWAIIAAEAAAEKKAENVMAIEVAELLVVTDFFVIATGRTDTQVKAIADEVEHQMLERGKIKPIGREGTSEGKWILLDYGDLVIHVFQPEERQFYRLEKLWGDAPRVELDPEVVNFNGDVMSDDESLTEL
jgi:ribosome-associated protein